MGLKGRQGNEVQLVAQYVRLLKILVNISEYYVPVGLAFMYFSLITVTIFLNQLAADIQQGHMIVT